jgi:hypothetical protein
MLLVETLYLISKIVKYKIPNIWGLNTQSVKYFIRRRLGFVANIVIGAGRRNDL